jgi:hypothetical protein
MDEGIQELYEDLQSDDQGDVESAAVEIAKIARDGPERIQPTVERLQELVRNGSGRAPGKALSALARFESELGRGAIDPVEDEIVNLLEDNRFNQQNALVGVTVSGKSRFADMAQRITKDSDKKTAAAATLAFVRTSGSELEWLPIREKQVHQLVSGGVDVLRDERPEYLLYLMDARCDESGQGMSARDHWFNLNRVPPDLASSVTQFVNQYPDEAVSSLHIGLLSYVAERNAKTVIETLEDPGTKLREADGQELRQYLWTMANIAEEAPEEIDMEIVEIARQTVADGDKKQAVQAIRLLEELKDTESRELIENRMEGGQNKVQSAGREALKSLNQNNGESDYVSKGDSASSHSSDTRRESMSDPGQQKDCTRNPQGRLLDLRERAEKAAQENPVREQVTSTSSQYYRSTPVKEYAKARANGRCECCDEPAPFKDTEGEPYLEVHHVDELGEGGADHPDRVAAICPTCHMRIHYGADGGKLNTRLQEQLKSGPSDKEPE